MEENYRRYPIGIQNFEQLRNNNNVYVDKTELKCKMPFLFLNLRWTVLRKRL